MSSKPQRKSGYPLPENDEEEETQSFCITIPSGYEYQKAMESQLEALGLWWKWKRSDDRMKAATNTAMTWRRHLLIEEDCGGGLVATKDDIRDGMYEAFNRLALQIASGTYANLGFTTDADGIVTPTLPDALPESPEDDPATPLIREDWAAQMGGAIAVSRALELFFDKVDAYYGAVNGTPVTSEASCQIAIKSYFQTDGAIMDGAITNYYSYRGANNRLLFDTTDAIEAFLFCNGADESGFNKWMIDLSAYAEQKRVIMQGLVSGLADEFFSYYYGRGLLTPSTEYRAASCTPFDPETIVFSGADFTGTGYKNGGVVNKNNHRVLIDVTGIVPDTAGGTQDFFWRKDGAGVLTFIGPATANGTWQVNSNWTAPSAAEVPYRTDGHYQVTRDTVTTGAGFLNIRRKLTESGTGHSMTMTITDLGAL